MFKVVVDTNVFISGLLGIGPSNTILNLWRNKKFFIVISTELTDELITTLNRPKISKRIPKEDTETLIELIEERAVLLNPRIRLKVCRDSHDDKLLECALEGEADLIVSGDADLLVLNPFKNINILSPADFMKRFKAAQIS